MMDSKGFTSYQQILELEQTKRIQREKLTLFQKPFLTLCIFSIASYTYIKAVLKYLLLHPLMIYFLIPIVFLWFITEAFPGPHTQIINQFEFYIEFTVWWVGLGILSSIGFGSGLQTGLLFLFPHILRVSLAAQTCKTLDFESDTNIWFRSPKALFQCPSLTPESTPVTFHGIWCKIIGVCFLQAAGTAIGEIPPYWITRAARLASNEADAGTKKLTEKLHNTINKNSKKKSKEAARTNTTSNNNNSNNNTTVTPNNNNSSSSSSSSSINHPNNRNIIHMTTNDDNDDEDNATMMKMSMNNITMHDNNSPNHNNGNNNTTTSTTTTTTIMNNMNSSTTEMPEELLESSSTEWSVYNQLKSMMIKFLQKYGFYGVLIMASFPNIAFDICGVYCGHYLMPFWTFFGATFIGKVLIRNTYQSFIYVALCSEKYLEMLIQLLQYLSPDSLQCDKIIRQVLEESRASFHRNVIAAVAATGVIDNSSTSGSSSSSKDNFIHGSETITASSSSSSSSSYANTVFFYWQLFMFIILLSFLLSCVSHFAQYHQLMIDTEEIKQLKNELGLTTPMQSPMHPLSNNSHSHSSGISSSHSKIRHNTTHIIHSPHNNINNNVISSRSNNKSNHYKNSNINTNSNNSNNRISDSSSSNDKNPKSLQKKVSNSNSNNSSSSYNSSNSNSSSSSLFTSPTTNQTNNNSNNNRRSNTTHDDDDDDDDNKYDLYKPYHHHHHSKQFGGYSTSIANSGISLTSAVIHNSINSIGTLSSHALNSLLTTSHHLSPDAQPKRSPPQSSSSSSYNRNNHLLNHINNNNSSSSAVEVDSNNNNSDISDPFKKRE